MTGPAPTMFDTADCIATGAQASLVTPAGAPVDVDPHARKTAPVATPRPTAPAPMPGQTTLTHYDERTDHD